MTEHTQQTKKIEHHFSKIHQEHLIIYENASKTNKGICKFTEGEGIDITASDGEITISGEDATVLNKGIASFFVDDFTLVDGVVSIRFSRTHDEYLKTRFLL